MRIGFKTKKRAMMNVLPLLAAVGMLMALTQVASAHDDEDRWYEQPRQHNWHSGWHHDWHSGQHIGQHRGLHWDPYYGLHYGKHYGPHSEPHHESHYGSHHDWYGGDFDDR